MTKSTLMITVCASLLWSATVLAAPTPQQKCDYARITAWKTYQSCIENVVAKDAKGVIFDEDAAFARCRHTYFIKWNGFQKKAFLAGSTCIGSRFSDNGNQTVTDQLTGLVWEKKDNLDGTANYLDPHDADNTYVWGFGYLENGDVFVSFLRGLNSGSGFAGSNGWRLPALAELQTIVLDFPCRGIGLDPQCTCPSTPCVDPALDAANTRSTEYWTLTVFSDPFAYAWRVFFNDGLILPDQRSSGGWVRAVRGGL